MTAQSLSLGVTGSGSGVGAGSDELPPATGTPRCRCNVESSRSPANTDSKRNECDVASTNPVVTMGGYDRREQAIVI